VIPMRIGIADPRRQLAHIAATTAERKRLPPYRLGAGLMLRWMTRIMPRQRLVNLLVSNLPGPAQPLSVASSPVLELAQIGVVQGNIPLSVGAISYVRQLTIDIVADRNAVPDLDTFAAGLRDVLRDLDVLQAA
jgi:diacylglycerol O-acyltransferase / wax synthase